MSYLLSIIIPTKNRYQYLQECLLSLRKLDPRRVEIIVQDNSDDTSSFKDFLNNLEAPNIRYYHQDGFLSQTDNSDLAVSHASGEYCCFIGDDDSVSSLILPVVELLKTENIPACVCDVATFYWPDVVFEGAKRAPLSFNKTKPYIINLRSEKVLKEVLSYGIQDIKYLARVYHGIISRNVLSSVKELCGSYFPGPSPDMANAVSCTSIIPSYYYVHLPLIISGYSYKSAGGMGLRGAHKGSLKVSEQLPTNVEDGWDEKIPKLWLGYTMWPQSGLSALQAIGTANLEKMNYNAMYAKIYLRYPEYRDDVRSFCKTLGSKLLLLKEIIRFGIRWTKERLSLKIRMLNKTQYINRNQMSLIQAKDIVDTCYDSLDLNNLKE